MERHGTTYWFFSASATDPNKPTVEFAGVGCVMNLKCYSLLLDIHPVNDRVLKVGFRGAPNFAFVCHSN